MRLHLMIVRREGGNEREGKRGKKRDRERRQIIKLTAAALILVHDA